MPEMTAKIKILGDVRGLLRGLKQGRAGVQRFGDFLANQSARFMRAGAVLVGMIGALVKQGIAYGTTIDKIAEMTGVAHEDVSRLAYSTELYHGSVKDLQKGLKRLGKNLYDADRELAIAVDAFETAGIAVHDMDGNLRSASDVLLDLTDYISKNADETESLGIAQDLLGRAAENMLPWMKQGRDVIEENFREADRLGMTLDSRTSKAMENLGTVISRVRIVLRGISVQVALVLAPAVENLANRTVELLARFHELGTGAKTASVKVGLMSGGLLVALGVIGKLRIVLGALTGPIGMVVAGFGLWKIALETTRGILYERIAAYDLLAEKTGEAAEAQTALAEAEMLKAASGAIFVENILNANFWLGQLMDNLADMDSLGGRFGDTWRSTLEEFVENARLAAQVARDDAAAATERWAEKVKKLGAELAAATTQVKDWAQAARDSVASYDQEIADLEETQETVAESVHRTTKEGEDGFRRMKDGVRSVSTEITSTFNPAIKTGANAVETFLYSANAFTTFLEEEAPQAAQVMLGVTGQLFEQMAEKSGKWFKTLKKALAQSLREIISSWIDMELQKLLAAQIEAMASAGMAGFLDPSNWFKMAGILALYGTAKAALSQIKSFAVGGAVGGSGPVPAVLHGGEGVLTSEAMNALFSKGKIGGDVNVTAHINAAGMTPNDLGWELRKLARAIAYAQER